MSMTEIESACKELSDYRAKLRRAHELRQKEIRMIDATAAPELRHLQGRCSAIRESLEALVEQARPEFKKPKTREFHGITVGFEKGRDTIAMPEDATLIDRIEKMLPAKQAETVLDRSVRIIKAAFKKLPRELLQKLGCNIITGGDAAIVRANDDDIETLVQKSLGDAPTAIDGQSSNG